MIIFAKKHFSQKNAKLFSAIINSAIYLRAGIAIFNRFVKRIFLPLTDASLIIGGIYLIKNYWETKVKASEGLQYPTEFLLYWVPAFTIVWLFCIFINGGYDKPISLRRTLRGVIIGTFTILVIYSLLPEIYRNSSGLGLS